MFTGLVQKIGRLVSVEMSGGSGRLSLQSEPWDSPWTQGESISIQGVCLTLVEYDQGLIQFDLLRETLERSSLGKKRPGQRLNLERALKMGDALGGHIVTGHVDGVGRVSHLTRAGQDWAVEIECDNNLLSDIVPKGSVTCDGISLTIVELTSHSFMVHLIPHTWDVTSFSEVTVGTTINLETDVLGKYVRRILETKSQPKAVTWETLKSAGFIS